jgi:hypothetical protein
MENLASNTKVLADYYGVDLSAINKCIEETGKLTGYTVADIHECLMGVIMIEKDREELLPLEKKLDVFNFLSVKDFIKICELNKEHAELCKKAWYWKQYLADKDFEDYIHILKFTIGIVENEEMQKIASMMIEKFVSLSESDKKKYLPKMFTYLINLEKADEDNTWYEKIYQILGDIPNGKKLALNHYFSYVIKAYKGSVKELGESELYKRYKKIAGDLKIKPRSATDAELVYVIRHPTSIKEIYQAIADNFRFFMELHKPDEDDDDYEEDEDDDDDDAGYHYYVMEFEADMLKVIASIINDRLKRGELKNEQAARKLRDDILNHIFHKDLFTEYDKNDAELMIGVYRSRYN